MGLKQCTRLHLTTYGPLPMLFQQTAPHMANSSSIRTFVPGSTLGTACGDTQCPLATAYSDSPHLSQEVQKAGAVQHRPREASLGWGNNRIEGMEFVCLAGGDNRCMSVFRREMPLYLEMMYI